MSFVNTVVIMWKIRITKEYAYFSNSLKVPHSSNVIDFMALTETVAQRSLTFNLKAHSWVWDNLWQLKAL